MKKFIPKKSDKEVISVRLDGELLNTVDIYAGKYEISRNEFINQCLLFAIENIEENK